MNKEVIDLNVQRAISAINDSYDFSEGKLYLSKALDEVGSNKKLAYYDVLRNVLLKLHYNVRGFSKKHKVKECYKELLHFYQREFECIPFVEIDENSEIDMGLCNSICCDIVKNVGTFSNGMRQFYMDIGILTALGNNASFLNEFMPIILKTEKAARDLMVRFSNPTSQIRQNISTWESEINGKYGRKYL